MKCVELLDYIISITFKLYLFLKIANGGALKRKEETKNLNLGKNISWQKTKVDNSITLMNHSVCE